MSHHPFSPRASRDPRWIRWLSGLVHLFDQPREELNRIQRLLVDFIRFVYRTPRRMAYNRWLFHASALAYQTLLGLVPALAITLAVLSNGAFDSTRTQFMDKIVDALYPLSSSSRLLDDAADRATLEKLNHQGKAMVRDSISKFAGNAGKVGVFGFLGLLLVCVLLVRSIEMSFNQMWDVPRTRPWGKHVTRTLFLLLAVPAAILATLLVKKAFCLLPFLRPGSNAAASFIWGTAYPYLCVAAGLSFLYRFFPHTKVNKRPAWGAGLLAAFALEICRHAFTFYAVKVLTVSRVYGTLAVVPLVMVWLYFSWAMVIFGAEAAHVLQTIDHPDPVPARR